MTSHKGDPDQRVVVADSGPSSSTGQFPSTVVAWIGAALVFALIVAFGAGARFDDAVDPIEVPVSATPPSLARDPLLELRGPALGVESEVILIFDDGLDGLLYVDPDRRIATRRTEGLQRQSRRAQLDQVGDVLLVGGVVTEALSLSTRQTTRLPEASYHLIAPDGSLWLVDVSPAAEVIPIPIVTNIGLDGEVLTPTRETPIRGVPSAAVAGGLVIDTPQGLFLWDPDDDTVTELTADGGALVLGASGPQLAWCPHDCRTVFIENVAADSTVEVPVPRELGAVDHTTTAWSPHGDELVVITTEAVVRITDIATTPRVVVLVEYAIGAGAPRVVAWDPSGEHVYFATDSPRGRLTGVWRSDGSRLGTATATFPFSGVGGPLVVLDASQAGWLVGERLGAYDDCPAPATVQLPEPNVCSFRF